jgi:hypothetical protein
VSGKPKRLRVAWSKRERALLYHFEDYSSNSSLLSSFFEHLKYPGEKTLAQELEARGYDLTTLKFSIQKKP